MKKHVLKVKKAVLMLQNGLNKNPYYKGLLSLSEDEKSITFEEAVPSPRKEQSPKLFDGKYLTMVRNKQGKYQCYLKAFDPSKADNVIVLGQNVSAEINKCFERFKTE